jgi:pyridoxamine 5'-phosphate oxidase
MDLSEMREEFTKLGLEREDLSEDPVSQFETWFMQAHEGGVAMPNAMSLATVDAQGQPSIRTVLLKLFDREGFVFYTNYSSKKAADIAANPKVALLFHWPELERQIRITGTAEKVSTAESAKYFLTRPRGSQIGAWSSDQSSVINSRQLLHAKFEEISEKFKHGEVPIPSFWGGYRVIPNGFEFWQGRVNRLHDRFAYRPLDGQQWDIHRLAP